jgi:hypothetical protein
MANSLDIFRKQGSSESQFPSSPHPELDTSYCLEFSTWDLWMNGSTIGNTDNTENTLLDDSYFNWLRRVSYTSCLFRQELAEVFWCRTSLSFDPDEHNFEHLENLLRKMPSISKGIKYLNMEMEYMFEKIEGQMDIDEFIQQCRRLSLFVSLGKLKLEF